MRCLYPITLKNGNIVPCGHCVGCLSRRQDDWTFRLQVEQRYSSSAIFLTLTYDERNVPIYVDSSTGISHHVLSKRDIQLFLKRLRKRYSQYRLRYFCCGEYGPSTFRPHYHLIVFNLPLNYENFKLPKELCEIWGKGYVTVSRVTHNRLHYVSKYSTCVNDIPDVLKQRQFKPFSLSSRRPAIGLQYVTEQIKDWHHNLHTGEEVGSVLGFKNYVLNNGHKQALPRYYKLKIFSSLEQSLLSSYIRNVIQSDDFLLNINTDYDAKPA